MQCCEIGFQLIDKYKEMTSARQIRDSTVEDIRKQTPVFSKIVLGKNGLYDH